jgi:hypothetical protein
MFGSLIDASQQVAVEPNHDRLTACIAVILAGGGRWRRCRLAGRRYELLGLCVLQWYRLATWFTCDSHSMSFV